VKKRLLTVHRQAWWLVLLFSSSCGEGSAAVEPAARKHVASASCRLRTPADWQGFVESLTEDARWVRTCSDLTDCRTTLADFAEQVEREVIAVLDECQSDIDDNPPIRACTEHLRRYVPAWQQQHGIGSYGFVQPNAEYFAAQTTVDVPAGMMDPPSELISALPTRAVIEAVAREQGFVYLTHDSALGGVRTFVNVREPEGRFEQWFLFGMENGASAVSDPSILSFIAVQKADVNGAVLARPRLHFRDYVVSSGAGGWSLALPEGFEGKCYACHSSGVRLLMPWAGPSTESAPVRGEEGFGSAPSPGFGARRLSELNERLLALGPPDWNGTIEPAHHGPLLGMSLGCTHCHDGRQRGTLSVSTSEGTLYQKLVEQLSMRAYRDGVTVPDERAMELLGREKSGSPPLDAAELVELAEARALHLGDYEALVAERFPAWQAWVLERRCD
jgi:hypothetical protein